MCQAASVKSTAKTIMLAAYLALLSGASVLAEAPVVAAVEPGCTTFTKDGHPTSSCWIGINPWEATTQGVVTASGGKQATIVTEVWTAKNSLYLGVDPSEFTTESKVVTTKATKYISFVTQPAPKPTKSGDSGAGSMVIEGVVIAPALYAALQPVADSANGKSAAQITSEINNAMKKLKLTLTAGDVQILASYMAAAAPIAAAAGLPFIIGPFVNNAVVTVNPAADATHTSDGGGATVTTTTKYTPTVMAIVVTQASDWNPYKSPPAPTGTWPTTEDPGLDSSKTESHTQAPSPTSSPVQWNCTGSGTNYPSFSLANADNAIGQFCVDNRPLSQLSQTYPFPSGGNIAMTAKFADNQDGCAKPDKPWTYIPVEDCKNNFGTVVNNCDLDTTDKKNGGVLTWHSSGGCIELDITGTRAS